MTKDILIKLNNNRPLPPGVVEVDVPRHSPEEIAQSLERVLPLFDNGEVRGARQTIVRLYKDKDRS